LKEDYKNIEEKKEKINKHSIQLQNEIANLKKKKKNMEKNLENTNLDHKNKIEKSDEDKKTLNTKLDELQNKNSKLNEQKSSLKKSLDEFKNQADLSDKDVKRKIQSLIKENEKKISKLDENKQLLSSLEKKLKYNDKKSEDKSDKFKDKIHILKDKIRDHGTELRTKDDKITEYIGINKKHETLEKKLMKQNEKILKNSKKDKANTLKKLGISIIKMMDDDKTFNLSEGKKEKILNKLENFSDNDKVSEILGLFKVENKDKLRIINQAEIDLKYAKLKHEKDVGIDLSKLKTKLDIGNKSEIIKLRASNKELKQINAELINKSFDHKKEIVQAKTELKVKDDIIKIKDKEIVENKKVKPIKKPVDDLDNLLGNIGTSDSQDTEYSALAGLIGGKRKRKRILRKKVSRIPRKSRKRRRILRTKILRKNEDVVLNRKYRKIEKLINNFLTGANVHKKLRNSGNNTLKGRTFHTKQRFLLGANQNLRGQNRLPTNYFQKLNFESRRAAKIPGMN
jgi:hypothetical protein